MCVDLSAEHIVWEPLGAWIFLEKAVSLVLAFPSCLQFFVYGWDAMRLEKLKGYSNGEAPTKQ